MVNNHILLCFYYIFINERNLLLYKSLLNVNTIIIFCCCTSCFGSILNILSYLIIHRPVFFYFFMHIYALSIKRIFGYRTSHFSWANIGFLKYLDICIANVFEFFVRSAYKATIMK